MVLRFKKERERERDQEGVHVCVIHVHLPTQLQVCGMYVSMLGLPREENEVIVIIVFIA